MISHFILGLAILLSSRSALSAKWGSSAMVGKDSVYTTCGAGSPPPHTWARRTPSIAPYLSLALPADLVLAPGDSMYRQPASPVTDTSATIIMTIGFHHPIMIDSVAVWPGRRGSHMPPIEGYCDFALPGFRASLTSWGPGYGEPASVTVLDLVSTAPDQRILQARARGPEAVAWLLTLAYNVHLKRLSNRRMKLSKRREHPRDYWRP